MKELKSTKKDNSTGAEKHRLRNRVLRECNQAPLVMETHGGWGRSFERVWFKARGGLVMEKDEGKTIHLARQRPAWMVYQCDSAAALEAGLARDRAFDIVDVDPYGMSLPTIDALMTNERTFPDCWHLVVNDGGRMKLRLGGAWHMKRIEHIVRREGNNIEAKWLEVLHECIRDLAPTIGFRLTHWEGYYCGVVKDMTHYWARLERAKP